ncbi:hypothetical protein L5F46_05195 [Aliarcobacter butzleri]|uniref:hypothetical protein n=1 Tax=Aliarcobacter butzleri TaxID=28197 RepID=UPI00125EA3CB|nr:hypothetical protein [Aliarcobacter butzleri]MCG3674169.1 hypothetical protein [Aliarcobacter butzleri]MCG3697350.1 hypothetical protein [Aliarcobacter butzleri]MCG3699420.1 hypothetical protein [Aliarcobacter butzleri]MCT7619443.1 hypothetical protein [Aliarcobacter butzleri]MCT7622193.1 hypothetical protein [Aliarcobacter butzleri]
MDLLTKECEVCGTKISKLKNWYRLVFTNEIKCSNCGSRYRLSKWLEFIFSFPTGGAGLMTLLFFIVLFFIYDIGMYYKFLWFEFVIYSLIISLLLKLLIMLFLPLKLIKSKKESENEQK